MPEPRREPAPSRENEPVGARTPAAADAVLRASLHGAAPLADRLAALVDAVRVQVGADRAALWLADGAALQCRVVAPPSPPPVTRVPLDTACTIAPDRHHAVAHIDGARHPLALALGAAPSGRPALEVPVFDADGRAGVLWIERHDRARPFAPAARALAATAADRIAVLLERERGDARRADDAARLHDAQRIHALGRLTSGVAHDFNNALTAILGGLQLVADGVANDAELAGFAARTLDAVGFASDLTHQLLEFSRGDRAAPHHDSIDAAVRRIDRLLRALLGDRRTLVLDLAGDAAVIAGSPTRLGQVVLNLVANARDAIADSGTVTIATAIVDDRVLLRVSDDGAGIPPAVQARMFEPLFTTKGRGEGSGLGLATVRHVVDELGGTIDVASAPGRGTTFTIRLPFIRR